MTIVIYILTVLFAIVCLGIVKQKRYKSMPFLSIAMFVTFIGCGIISVLSLILPNGKSLVFPLGVIIFGLMIILIETNDLYSRLRCREKVEGVYHGYNKYYGGTGVSVKSPVFEYTYKEINYREQTVQNISDKQLNQSRIQENVYCLYIDPKHPAVFILNKKIKVETILLTIVGVLILSFGVYVLLTL